MKPCSNPTCTHQIEDDAKFCGMCGTYVGPEMTSNATFTDFRRLVTLAAEEMWDLSPMEAENRIGAILQTLGQAERLGETQPSLAAATADAYVTLLQIEGPSAFSRFSDTLSRLEAVESLNRMARMMITHNQRVPSEVLSVLGANLPELIANDNFLGDRVGEARTFVQLLRQIALREPNRRVELMGMLIQFDDHCHSMLNMLDRTLSVSGAINVLYELLAK